MGCGRGPLRRGVPPQALHPAHARRGRGQEEVEQVARVRGVAQRGRDTLPPRAAGVLGLLQDGRGECAGDQKAIQLLQYRVSQTHHDLHARPAREHGTTGKAPEDATEGPSRSGHLLRAPRAPFPPAQDVLAVLEAGASRPLDRHTHASCAPHPNASPASKARPGKHPRMQPRIPHAPLGPYTARKHQPRAPSPLPRFSWCRQP